MKKLSLIFLCAVFAVACENGNNKKAPKQTAEDSALLERAKTLFQPISAVNNGTQDPAKVELGKYLFFDTRLSATGNISCNSCHDLATYGVDNKSVSSGDDGSFGNRNSPTVFHAALHKMQFWDGRAKDVEEQAGGPILNPVEHKMKDKREVEGRLKTVDMYREMFAKAFASEENPITFENATIAIGAFERTLMPESRFDNFLEGNTASLSAQEKKGLDTFISSGCISCHSGVALGGQMLQKFGLYHEYWSHTGSEDVDNGVADLDNNESMKYFFKVPGLRNIVHTAPYFHDGSVADLNKAVEIMGKLQVNLDLSEEQVNDIVTFLGCLSSDIPDEVKKSPFTTESIQ